MARRGPALPPRGPATCARSPGRTPGVHEAVVGTPQSPRHAPRHATRAGPFRVPPSPPGGVPHRGWLGRRPRARLRGPGGRGRGWSLRPGRGRHRSKPHGHPDQIHPSGAPARVPIPFRWAMPEPASPSERAWARRAARRRLSKSTCVRLRFRVQGMRFTSGGRRSAFSPWLACSAAASRQPLCSSRSRT